MPTKTISDVWKWIALTAFAWILGAGSATLYGKTALANHVTSVQKEAVEKKEVEDKLHQYQADVHSRLVDMIEANEKVLSELRLSQARVEAKLEILLDRL